MSNIVWRLSTLHLCVYVCAPLEGTMRRTDPCFSEQWRLEGAGLSEGRSEGNEAQQITKVFQQEDGRASGLTFKLTNQINDVIRDSSPSGQFATPSEHEKRRAAKARALARLGDADKVTSAQRERVRQTWERMQNLIGGSSQTSAVPPRVLTVQSVQSRRGRSATGRQASGLGLKYAMCKSAVHAWTDWVEAPGHNAFPENNLSLEWVYGYFGGDLTAQSTKGQTPANPLIVGMSGRNNLFYTADEHGELDGSRLAYYVSALGVVLDARRRVQAFYRFHDGEICCMATHPTRTLVATGQTASHGHRLPVISVWSPGKVFEQRPGDVQPESIIQGDIIARVCGLAFDQSGRHLFAIGLDEENIFGIYDWEAGTVLMKGLSGRTAMHMV